MPDPTIPVIFSTGDIRTYVRTALGAPDVPIELKDLHIDQAIGETLRLFNQYLMRTEAVFLRDQEGSVQITFPEDEGVLGVFDVQILREDLDAYYMNMNIFEIMHRMVFPNLPVGDWYLLRHFYRMYEKVRGTDPTWNYLPETRTLWVDCRAGPYHIFFYKMLRFTLPTLQQTYGGYFQRFLDGVLASSKKILARIRGKYKGIPAPHGTLTLDDQDLRGEGKEEWERVEKFLKAVSVPLAPMFA